MAAERVYIGGSSWKYEGWIGQVYSRANYLARGRFSRQLFESNCLKEYARAFPTVCRWLDVGWPPCPQKTNSAVSSKPARPRRF
jgi:hypothetical protein